MHPSTLVTLVRGGPADSPLAGYLRLGRVPLGGSVPTFDDGCLPLLLCEIDEDLWCGALGVLLRALGRYRDRAGDAVSLSPFPPHRAWPNAPRTPPADAPS